MANENGKSALQYLLEEVNSTVENMEKQEPDFSNCPVGTSFAEQQFKGTLLMLKMQRINVRESIEKSKKNDGGGRWGFFKIGANHIQASGVVAVAIVLVYLILKVHNVPVLP
jgi:type I restriction-modification system DNA methylase subunit